MQDYHETISESYLSTGCSEAENADELDGINPITFVCHMVVLAILLNNDNEFDRENLETIYFFIASLYYSNKSYEADTRWRQHIGKSECSSLQYESSLILDSMLPGKFEKTSDIQSTDKDKSNASDKKYENCGTADFNESRVDNNLKQGISCNLALKNQAENKGNEELKNESARSHL